MKFFHMASLVLGLLFGFCLGSGAAKEKLQGMIDTTLDVIYSQTHASLSANEKQLNASEARISYDLDVMIRYAIGKNWRRMNKKSSFKYWNWSNNWCSRHM